MATKTKLKYKVEWYEGKKEKINYFENQKAALNATAYLNSKGIIATVYKYAPEINTSWSKRGTYVPRDYYRKNLRISPKMPKLR